MDPSSPAITPSPYTTTASGSPSKTVTATARASIPRYASSVLSQPMIDPLLASSATFRASACGIPGRTRTCSRAFARARSSSSVPSLEPASTTICSTRACVCRATESRQSATKSTWLKDGVRIEIRGCSPTEVALYSRRQMHDETCLGHPVERQLVCESTERSRHPAHAAREIVPDDCTAFCSDRKCVLTIGENVLRRVSAVDVHERAASTVRREVECSGIAFELP